MNKTIQNIFNLLLLVFAVMLLVFQYNIIVFPYHMELREIAIIQSTRQLLEGVNFFSVDNMPQYLNLYGISYNIICAPFVKLFAGNDLIIHKAVTAFFSIASVLFFIYIQLKNNIHKNIAIATGLILYSNFLFGVMPLPRPDTLGTFLYLLLIFVPWLDKFSYRSLIFSMLCAIVSFYSKIYFVSGEFVLLLFIFLFVSKQKAIISGVIFITLFICSILVVKMVYPLYFYNVFLISSNAATYMFRVLFKQFNHYFFLQNTGITISVVILLLIIAYQFLKEFKTIFQRIKKLFDLNFLNFNEPLCNYKISVQSFFLMMNFMFIMLKLGGHGGSYMTYWYELISPFLFIVIAEQFSSGVINRYLSYSLLIVNMITCYMFLPNQNLQKEGFEKLDKYITKSKLAFVNPALGYLALRQNQDIVDNGLGEYFFRIDESKSTGLRNIFPLTLSLSGMSHEYIERVQGRMKDKYYDLVILDRYGSDWLNNESIIKSAYQLIDSVEVYMPQNNETLLFDVYK